MTDKLDFSAARDRAMLDILKKENAKFIELEKKYKQLQSEFNVLKRTHLGVVDDCIEKKHQLREKIKKQNDKYNKLLEREQNKGWNEL